MANDTIDAGKYGSKEIAAAAIEIALTKGQSFGKTVAV